MRGSLDAIRSSGCFANVGRLGTFLSLSNLELDGVSFLQALITFSRDRTVMHKDVGSIVTTDEAVAFGIVKPFHRTFQTFHVRPLRQASRLAVPNRDCRACLPILRHIVRRGWGAVKDSGHKQRGYFRDFRPFWRSASQRIPDMVLASRMDPFWTIRRASDRGIICCSMTSSASG